MCERNKDKFKARKAPEHAKAECHTTDGTEKKDVEPDQADLEQQENRLTHCAMLAATIVILEMTSKAMRSPFMSPQIC